MQVFKQKFLFCTNNYSFSPQIFPYTQPKAAEKAAFDFHIAIGAEKISCIRDCLPALPVLRHEASEPAKDRILMEEALHAHQPSWAAFLLVVSYTSFS